jgi:hypothetical protein
MVDCEHKASPLSGQRPTASFISGSSLSLSRSRIKSGTAVLVAAADREHARLDHLGERMLDPGCIATIGKTVGEPRTDAE